MTEHHHPHGDDHDVHAHPHDHGHEHGHQHHGHHHHGANASARRLSWALAILVVFTVIEAVGGWWVNSLALLSDAAHMVTDSAALAFALVALRLSQRPPDGALTYGHARWQTLAAFVNGLVLLVLTVGLIIESVRRLLVPEPVEAGWMLIIAVIGGLANLGALFALEGASSLNERGARLHVLSDLLGSVAAVIAALVILWRGWWIADPLLSLLVCALIVRSGWRLTRDSARVLLEGAPDGIGPDQVRDSLADVGGLASVHHVHVWSLDGAKAMVTLHASLMPDAQADITLRAIHVRLHDALGVEHATIQIETGQCTDPGHAQCHAG